MQRWKHVALALHIKNSASRLAIQIYKLVSWQCWWSSESIQPGLGLPITICEAHESWYIVSMIYICIYWATVAFHSRLAWSMLYTEAILINLQWWGINCTTQPLYWITRCAHMAHLQQQSTQAAHFCISCWTHDHTGIVSCTGFTVALGVRSRYMHIAMDYNQSISTSWISGSCLICLSTLMRSTPLSTLLVPPMESTVSHPTNWSLSAAVRLEN